MESSIRKKGLLKFIKGSFAGVSAGALLHQLQLSGETLNIFYLLAIATPAAWGLVGFLEMIINRPFSEMEIWWGSLKGWQRGVLSLLVVILSVVLMFSVVFILGYFDLI